MPTISQAQPPRPSAAISSRMPASLAPSIRRSFGHFSRGAIRPSETCSIASARARAATSDRLADLGRRHGRAAAAARRRDCPAGDCQLRPCRPRPAVCRSARDEQARRARPASARLAGDVVGAADRSARSSRRKPWPNSASAHRARAAAAAVAELSERRGRNGTMKKQEQDGADRRHRTHRRATAPDRTRRPARRST